jgi:hypothetical protein
VIPEIQPGELARVNLLDMYGYNVVVVVRVIATEEDGFNEMVSARVEEIGAPHEYIFPTSYLERLSPLEQLAYGAAP